MWSVGVVMLELVLGTPHVFQISSRTRALLDRRLQGWDQSAKETAYMWVYKLVFQRHFLTNLFTL